MRDGEPGRDNGAELPGDLGELVVAAAGPDLGGQLRLVGGPEPGEQAGVGALVGFAARQFPLDHGKRVRGDAGAEPGRRGRASRGGGREGFPDGGHQLAERGPAVDGVAGG
nr:hypothetical protein [Trebonia kvetii]